MPLFETTIPINSKQIQKIVSENWKLKLGNLIKASQNHTFEAFSEDGSKKFSVRVTPDPEKKHLQRITDELTFIEYLVQAKLNHICSPIPPIIKSAQKYFLVAGDLIIVVFEWAKGVPLPFGEFRWMNDKIVIHAWGKFFAQMHKISQQFSIDYPIIALRIQSWDEIHCGILKGIKFHNQDQIDINNIMHYGILHGDLNTSNIHFVQEGSYLSVYDTDQVQRGFYLWDLAQAIFTIVMLQEGGMPCSGNPVPNVDRKAYQEAMVAGYESEGMKVNNDRLNRMVDIKKQLYIRFAKQAEIQGNIPKDMEPFLKYINEFCEPKWKIVQ